MNATSAISSARKFTCASLEKNDPTALKNELTKLGADVQIEGDALVIQLPEDGKLKPAKIDTYEAAEMLLGIIQHDGPDERTAAVEALKRARGLRFVDLAREQIKQLAGPARNAVRDVLQTRGLPVS